MKLLEFKKQIYKSIKVLYLSIKYTFQLETAYRANTLLSTVSALIFGAITLIFVNVVYSNITAVAGYTKDQMYFFTGVAYISYYLNRYLFSNNIRDLILQVNTGGLDMILMKPFPSLFYILTKTINVIRFIREGLLAIILPFLLISWQNINLSIPALFSGILIIIMGQICVQFCQFVMSLPVFWFGESASLYDLSFVFDFRLGRFTPYEGIPLGLKVFFSTMYPILISTGISTSVLLGKTDPLIALFFTVVITILVLFMQNLLWKKALKSYTSASS